MKSLNTGKQSALSVRAARRVLIIAVVATFTPYLGIGPDVRFEQIILYSLLLVVALLGIAAGQLRLNAITTQLLFIWFFLGILISVNTAFRAQQGEMTVSPLAIVDGFLLPGACFLLGYLSVTLSRRRVGELLNVATAAVVMMLSANSLLILSFDPGEIQEVLRWFWSNPESSIAPISVAEKALLGDRYSGIFNQPFDGGVAYTIGVAAWLYRFPARGLGLAKQAIGITSLGLLISGGISTQSKAFVYGSLLTVALSVIYGGVGSVNWLRPLVRQVALGLVVLLAAGWLGLVTSFDRSLRYVLAFQSQPDSATSGLSLATGGRTDSLDNYYDRLWEGISFRGSGWAGAQDDALLAYLRGAGLIGLCLFALIIVLLTRIARLAPPADPTRVLGVTLVTFIVLASLGAVSLHVNRASSLFWILFGIMAAQPASRHANRCDVVAESGTGSPVQTKWPNP